MALTPKRMNAMNANIDAECPICQCKMIVPTTIPACGHKFCFICLKGVYMNDMGGCPMCRGPIDSNIFAQPSQVLDLKMNVPKSPIVTLKPKTAATLNSNQNVPALDLDASICDPEERKYWIYSGKNQGWWRFEPRNEREIEEAYNAGKCHCEVVICGRPYVIDFHQFLQYPRGVPNQARHVKRVSADDFDGIGVKGLAGIFVPTSLISMFNDCCNVKPVSKSSSKYVVHTFGAFY